jgi:hypothetical protein
VQRCCQQHTCAIITKGPTTTVGPFGIPEEAAMDELLTGPQAAELCGVSPITIRSWRHRGLLNAAGLDERGRPLYEQLAVARAEKATRKKAGRTLGQQAA